MLIKTNKKGSSSLQQNPNIKINAEKNDGIKKLPLAIIIILIHSDSSMDAKTSR